MCWISAYWSITTAFRARYKRSLSPPPTPPSQGGEKRPICLSFAKRGERRGGPSLRRRGWGRRININLLSKQGGGVGKSELSTLPPCFLLRAAARRDAKSANSGPRSGRNKKPPIETGIPLKMPNRKQGRETRCLSSRRRASAFHSRLFVPGSVYLSAFYEEGT